MSRAKKICVLGLFGVGKTSLVDRVAFDRFSTDYKTTIGVRPIPATIHAGTEREQKLVLWDIAGESDVSRLTRTYLTGAHGFAIVMDGLRADSVEAARRILQSCNEEFPDVPTVMLANKSDMERLWDVSFPDIQMQLRTPVYAVSARTGAGVVDAFSELLAGR